MHVTECQVYICSTRLYAAMCDLISIIYELYILGFQTLAATASELLSGTPKVSERLDGQKLKYISCMCYIQLRYQQSKFEMEIF